MRTTSMLLWTLLLASALPWCPVRGEDEGVEGEEAEVEGAGAHPSAPPPIPHPDLPDFAQGVSVTVLGRMDSCVRTVLPGNWLELEFVAKQWDDEDQELVEFDSTASRGKTFLVAENDPQLPGLTEGLKKVCVGERRLITIAANKKLLTVAPKSSLVQPETDREAVYEITVRSIQDKQPTNLFKFIDKDSDNKISREEAEEFYRAAGIKEEDHQKEVDMLFLHQDKDGNGEISFEEFQGPKYSHDEF